jgi:type II secretory pathway pseudopilin PulG
MGLVWGRRSHRLRSRRGISLVEILTVLIFIGIVLTFAMPRLNLRGIRMDGASRALNMTMLSAQRAAIQKQHTVVVAFDTLSHLIRIHEDRDNDWVVDSGELVRTVPLSEGIRFGRGNATPRAIGGAAVTFKHTQGGLPAMTFSRAGTASEIGGFYISSFGSPNDARSLEVERSTGRTERFIWNYQSGTWSRAF